MIHPQSSPVRPAGTGKPSPLGAAHGRPVIAVVGGSLTGPVVALLLLQASFDRILRDAQVLSEHLMTLRETTVAGGSAC